MLENRRSRVSLKLVGLSLLFAGMLMLPGDTTAQDEEEGKVDERYSAFTVAQGAGMAGVLDIAITRWSTDEERALLINALVEEGQEKVVELLRDQEETGWARTQSGRGMRTQPSTRLRYSREINEGGKRTVVLVTDRTMGFREVANRSRSSQYDVSAIVMELTKEGDEEKGQGVFLPAVKFAYDKEKNTLEIEHMGTQPVKLTSITRKK